MRCRPPNQHPSIFVVSATIIAETVHVYETNPKEEPAGATVVGRRRRYVIKQVHSALRFPLFYFLLSYRVKSYSGRSRRMSLPTNLHTRCPHPRTSTYTIVLSLVVGRPPRHEVLSKYFVMLRQLNTNTHTNCLVDCCSCLRVKGDPRSSTISVGGGGG